MDDLGLPAPEPGPDPSTLVPLGANPTWADVMEAVSYRCQCSRCPAHRRHEGFRCETEHRPPDVRLTVGPSDPSPDPARRPELSRGELVAWCEPCWTRAVSVSARMHRELMERRLIEQTDTLF